MNNIAEAHIFPISFSVNSTPIPKYQYNYNISTKALGLDDLDLNYNSMLVVQILQITVFL